MKLLPIIPWLLGTALLLAQAELEKPDLQEAGRGGAGGATKPTGQAATEQEEGLEVEDSGTTDLEEPSEPAVDQADETLTTGPVQLFGWKEWIYLEGHKKRIKTKLDTGAKTSSIHAKDVKMIEKDGKKWMRFTVVVPSSKGGEKEIDCEAPYTRHARIRNADGVVSERIVVRLNYRIGDLNREAEFSLNDRGDMIHPVLLGRSAIKTIGVMDASRIYLAKDKVIR